MVRAQVLKDGLELKQKQLQLQHDQEQLNLWAKISEVEAEERVYQMFEERDGLSDRLGAIRSSVEKLPLTPNAGEWPACIVRWFEELSVWCTNSMSQCWSKETDDWWAS